MIEFKAGIILIFSVISVVSFIHSSSLKWRLLSHKVEQLEARGGSSGHSPARGAKDGDG